MASERVPGYGVLSSASPVVSGLGVLVLPTTTIPGVPVIGVLIIASEGFIKASPELSGF